MTQQTVDTEVTLLRLDAVRQRTGLNRSAVYSLMAEGQFPKPVKIGPRAVAWPDFVINQWIQQRIEAAGYNF